MQIREPCSGFSPSGPWFNDSNFPIILILLCAFSLDSSHFYMRPAHFEWPSSSWTLFLHGWTGYIAFALVVIQEVICEGDCVVTGYWIAVTHINCLIIVLVSWNLYSSVLTQNMRKAQSTDCYFSVSRDVSTKFKVYQPCRPDWKRCNLHSGPKVCWGLCVCWFDYAWHVLCSPPCHVRWLKRHDES